MPPIEDHDYLKICAELASYLSISLSSARKKVELAAMKSGRKDLATKKEIARELLSEASSKSKKGEMTTTSQLDELLKALSEEENFMVED